MKEDASYSTSVTQIHEDITATTDFLASQLPSPPVTDLAIDGLSTFSLSTELMGHRSPDVIVVEHTAVGHTPLSDVEIPFSSSPTPVLKDFLPIGMLLPLDSAISL